MLVQYFGARLQRLKKQKTKNTVAAQSVDILLRFCCFFP